MTVVEVKLLILQQTLMQCATGAQACSRYRGITGNKISKLPGLLKIRFFLEGKKQSKFK